MKKIQAHLIGEIVQSNDPLAMGLSKKSALGEQVGDKIQYSLSEAYFLVETEKLEIIQGNKKLAKTEVIKKFNKIDKKFQIKSCKLRCKVLFSRLVLLFLYS